MTSSSRSSSRSATCSPTARAGGTTAVERLWITAGNVAEAHRISAALHAGTGPWAELYRLRNLLAHALPGDLSSDRLWAETVADLPRLLAEVGQHRG